jgi:hypothetical protein
MQSTDTTLELWNHLFGDLEGYLVAFTGRQARLDRTGARQNELRRTEQRSFAYPKEAPQAEEYLLKAARAGRDAYFGPHLYKQPGNRLASNAVDEVSTLWLDEDDGQFPDVGPEPTAVLRSSEARRQLYWELSRPIPAERAVELNRRIAIWSGGDRGKAGLASVLRAPGTLNFKRHPKVDVVTVELTEVPPWDPEVIDQAIPPLREPETKARESYVGPEGANVRLLPWLEANGVEVLFPSRDEKGEKFAIACPWVEEHTGGDRTGTYVGQYPAADGSPNGATWFWCWHEHCQGRDWTEFRNRVEPRPRVSFGKRRRAKVYARREAVI